MLTVRELLADIDLKPLTGETTLDAPIRWVHSSELPDPSPWLSGGELMLTTGMGLDTEAAQREYVGRLADHGLAGLGLGTGFVHEEIPKALLDAARERDFVVFEVPYDTPFIAITEQAFSRLVNEQYALLQRSIAAQERLQRIVLGERGLDAIAAALSALIGGSALVFEGRGEPAAQRTFRRELSEEAAASVSAELHERARRGDGRGFAPTHAEVAGRALALPISAPTLHAAGRRASRRRGSSGSRTPAVSPSSTGSSSTRPSPSSRSSCSAAGSPTRPSAASRATCSPASCPVSSRARSSPAASSRSGWATA